MSSARQAHSFQLTQRRVSKSATVTVAIVVATAVDSELSTITVSTRSGAVSNTTSNIAGELDLATCG